MTTHVKNNRPEIKKSCFSPSFSSPPRRQWPHIYYYLRPSHPGKNFQTRGWGIIMEYKYLNSLHVKY